MFFHKSVSVLATLFYRKLSRKGTARQRLGNTIEMINDQARIDLAAAFRWAARLDLHEGVAIASGFALLWQKSQSPT